MTQRLFVYGTLGPGRPNAHVLEVVEGTWSEASVNGHLHNEGWGATMGYPAIKLDPQAPEVEGFIFSSDKFDAHWARLDEFEGEAYERITCQANLKDGSTVEAFVYALKQA